MSGSSSSSLSRLLSQTKLSSFDPKLPQIYTSPKAYSDRGDWGFTKSIPPTSSSSSKRLQYLILSNLESNSGHIPWKSNESRPRFLKRFKENPIRFNNGSNLNNNSITHNGLSTSASSSSSLSPGSLGPRPRSIFDKHSYRPLPIESLPTQAQNDELSDQDKLLLQSKRNSNRSGYGYLYSNTGDLREIKGTSLDPLGENSDQYSNHSNLFPNYNLMSDKQFEKFIEKIRLDEHGLMTSTSSDGEEQSEKKKAGNYRKELERKEFNQRRDLLNRLKERYRDQAIYQVRAAKETGATPTSDALYFSKFDSSEKIPDHEFLKRSNGTLNETMGAIIEDGKDGSSEAEDGIKKKSSSGVEIDLWNEARKINTFNSADYLRKTLSFLESSDPNSTKLPTSSLVGGGGGGNKSNSTGTRHSREGLQYSNPDKIYTSRLSEPIKGRVLNDQARDNRTFRRNGFSSNRNSNANLIVGMNGLITELPKGSKEGLEPIDYHEGHLNKSIGKFRFTDANLQRENETYLTGFQSGGNEISSSSSSSNGDFFLPSLIQSRVRSVRESDVNKKPSNDTIPGSKSWLIEKDGNLKTISGNKFSNYALSVDDYSRPRNYSGSNPYQGAFGSNRERKPTTSAASLGGQGSTNNALKTGFPYSRNETQLKINRDSVAQKRRLERAQKGEENYQEANKAKKEVLDGLSKLKL